MITGHEQSRTSRIARSLRISSKRVSETISTLLATSKLQNVLAYAVRSVGYNATIARNCHVARNVQTAVSKYGLSNWKVIVTWRPDLSFWQGVKSMSMIGQFIRMRVLGAGLRGNKNAELSQRLTNGLGKTWSQNRTFG
jgi:hypothetical protein